jgi:RNA polymerase sigma-70 factor (ECF subfamily)
MSAFREKWESTPDAMQFRTTNWEMVSGAADTTSAAWAQSLEDLCQIYWLPVYAFIRKRGHPPEAAEDLTQEFFAHILHSDFLSRAEARRGRFRSFLMASIENFLHVEHRNATTQKRGGGWQRLQIDDEDVERFLQAELADTSTPEVIFERQWGRTLIGRVFQKLEQEFSKAGRSALFQALKPHLAGDPGALPYQAIALSVGATLTGIKVTVHRARRRFQELLRAEVTPLVANAAEVDDEIRHLLRLLS